MYSKAAISQLAEITLKKSGIKFGKKPVVDVRKLAEKLGIEVREKEFDTEISGVLKIDDDDSATILVNSGHHQNRIRFTIAHELGHFVLHKARGVHVDKVFMRDSKSSEGLHRIEIEANRFASEILMPRKKIEESVKNIGFLDTADEVADLALKFGVSTIAMSIKLQEMGYISADDLAL